MKESYNKAFFSLLGVTVAGMLIEFLFLLTDQLVASHLLGEDALAGVGLAHPVELAVEIFTAMFYAGAGVRLLAAKGTGSETAVRKVFSTAFAAAILGGAVLGGLVWCYRFPITAFFGADPIPTYHCLAYLRYYSLALALMPLEGLFLETLYLEEDISLCLVLMPVRLIGNAVASAVLCRWMGCAGIALGSVVASILGIATASLHFLRKDNSLRLGVEFSPQEFWRIVRCSSGDLAYPLFELAVATVITRLAIAWFGAETLPVITVVIDILTFTILFEGFGQAVEPTVGAACSAHDFATVNGVIRTASLTLLMVAAALGAVMICFPGAVLTVMAVEEPSLVAAGLPLVRVMGFSFIGIGFVRLFNTCYQFVNRPGAAFWLTFLGGLAAPLGIPYLVGTRFGLTGFVTGFSLAPYLGIAVFLILLLFFRRGRSFPMLLSKDCDADGRDIELLCSRTRLPFRITRAGIVSTGIICYLLVMGALYLIWTDQAKTAVEHGFHYIEERFAALGANGLGAEELRCQAKSSYVMLDYGWLAVLSEDGESIDMPGDVDHERRIFEIGFDRASIDTHRTYRAVLAGIDIQYRIVTAGSRRILALISDFDVFWERDRQLLIVGFVLLLMIAATVFVISANLEDTGNGESTAKD